ncbi:MAG: FG-GAP repeat protein [Planctomycetaceae bacterium]|nr:FG-GAP repeat protein [Planctomycetaceae bacterium]
MKTPWLQAVLGNLCPLKLSSRRRRWKPATELLECRQMLTAPDINIASLLPTNGGNGSAGVSVFGIDGQDDSGYGVSEIGDLNGDGISDIIIGARDADGLQNSTLDSGESYVVFGRTNWDTSPALKLSDLDGTNGFVLSGAARNDYSGQSVAGIGDFNGDGYDDVAIGAFNAFGHGDTYVVFGKQNWSSTPVLNLISLNGTNGITISGRDRNDEMGGRVASAGDFNGDGYSDLLISAKSGSGPINDSVTQSAGECYVVFGAPSWNSTPVLNVSSLNGQNGVTFYGTDGFDVFGSSIGGLLDFNGDGFDDVAVGAVGDDGPLNARSSAGAVYVFFGRSDWSSTPILIASDLNGSSGFVFYGQDVGDLAGIAVNGAGDVNGDGYFDLIVGASYGDGPGNAADGSGEVYVVFGKANWTATPSLQASNLNGQNGFTLWGADSLDEAGTAVSSAGDVDEDGFDDLLVGAFVADGPDNLTTAAGESYVVFGKADWSLTATLSLSNLDGTNGFRVFSAQAGDETGFAVNSGGDFNNDGYHDFLIGARHGNGITNLIADAGETHVIFGKNFFGTGVGSPTGNGDQISGSGADDLIRGLSGSDNLFGFGGKDVILGGPGDDMIAISSLSFQRIDGGTGFDTLRIDIPDAVIDLTQMSASRLSETEAINLRGNGISTLILNPWDVSSQVGRSNLLRVFCDAGEILQIGSNWVRSGSATFNGESFAVYVYGGLKLQIPEAAAAPVISLSASAISIQEGGGTMNFTATIPATVTYPVTVLLGFSGTAVAGSDYSISSRQITIPAGQRSGSVQITGLPDTLPEGNETIVVDIVSSSNAVESGTQRVTAYLTALSAPVILTPAAVTMLTQPKISWAAVPNALSHDVWLNNQTTGVAQVIRQTVTTLELTPQTPLGIGRYNLWIRSLGAGPEASLFSAQYNFRITTPAEFQSVARYQTSAKPTISWKSLPGAASYDFWLDYRTGQTSQYVRATSVSGTSWTAPSDLPMGEYRAWVRGLDAKGEPASWSVAVDFLVLPTVSPLTPGPATFDRTPTFSWQPVLGASSYEFRLTDANNGTTILSQNGLSTASFTPGQNLLVGTYRWSVVAVNSLGFKSQQATANSLMVGGRPSVLTPLASTNDSTPDFTWTIVDDAATYELFVSRIDVPATGVINVKNLTNARYTPVTSLPIGTYRIWVRAISTTGEISSWSLQRDFQVTA